MRWIAHLREVSPARRSADDPMAGDLREREALIRNEQVRLLYQGTPLVVLSTVLVAALLVLVQWPAVPHADLMLWLALSSTVSVGRGILWQMYQHRNDRSHPRRWCLLYAFGAVLSGSTWGAAAWLAFPEGQVSYQLIPVLMVAGVAAFGSTTLSVLWPIVPAFLLACLFPWSVRFATMEGSVALATGAIVLLLIAYLTVSARRVHDNIAQNLSLRLEVVERERTLKESEERYRQIFRHSPLGVMHYLANGEIVECNSVLAGIVGMERDQIVGMNLLADVVEPAVHEAVRGSLSEQGEGYYEDVLQLGNESKPVAVRGFFRGIRAWDGSLTGGVCILEDYSERRRIEKLIQHQASYDELTDLPNRRLLLDRLGQALAARQRHGGVGAVLFLDLDHFKSINDSLGHRIGDTLLKQVAQRLRMRVRSEDTAARLGGDEFVVLLPDIGADCKAAGIRASTVAAGYRNLLSAPYHIGDHALHLTPSIGVAFFPESTAQPEDIIKHADIAMYQVKRAGRGEVRFYQASMQEELNQRLSLEKDLRVAVSDRALRVHLQPEVDAGGRIRGAEVLVRWHHPRRGWVSPTQFIPVAEDSGLIVALGDQVLEQACRALKKLDANVVGAELGHLAVNVSPRQFQQPEFVDGVLRTLEQLRIDPHRLTLEITEGLLLQNIPDTVRRMEALKQAGVRFAIDDFGTGYSSLSYLNRLPLDVLKIDRSFVSGIGSGARKSAIVETILSMARHLGLAVVAEGVETSVEFELLKAHDCDRFQGYYFSEAVPLPDFARLLNDHGGVLRPQQPANSAADSEIAGLPATPMQRIASMG